MSSPDQPAKKQARLQWGRARASAEMPAHQPAQGRCVEALQWGRARASAEITAVNCFRPWVRWPLQWGRARASAEIRAVCHVARRRHYAASMGPRSCERGNLFSRPSVEWSNVRLQWGRARASAEISRNSSCSCALHSFNGAALVRARKSTERGGTRRAE